MMPTDRTNAARQARRRAQFTAMKAALKRIALEAATIKEARAIALEALEDRG
jgi:hypothetical protein